MPLKGFLTINFRYYLLQLVVYFCSTTAFAQSTATVSIEVGDANIKPIVNIEVTLQEQSTQQQMKARTNSNGKVDFVITNGNNWAVLIDGYKYEQEVIERDEDASSTLSLYITHNPALNERMKKQTFSRTDLNLKIIDQSDLAAAETKPGHFELEIKVVNSAGRLQTEKEVHIICLDKKTMYISFTNDKGVAIFQLPSRQLYDIDVEEHLNASFINNDLPDGFTFYKTLVYDTYDMDEQDVLDTITQKIRLPLVKKNSRAPYRVTMKKTDGSNCPNEPVYLNEVNSKKVYMATTDSNGEALFILPFGKKYLVNFNFQKDVDVLNLTNARGSATGSLTLTYQPNPALEFPEKFIPTPATLLLTDFSYYHTTPYPPAQKPGSPGIFLRTGSPSKKQGEKEMVLETGISAFQLPAGKRMPLNVSFVLDKSGSMSGYERIESLKEGFEKLINQLLPEDRISIFLFDDDMQLLLPSSKIGDRKKAIIELIRSIEPNGGTSMMKAMQAAYAEVKKYHSANAVNTVVLLTDGFDERSAEELVAAQKPFNASIACTAIGVGKDYNYDLMKQLASKGSGLLLFAAEGKELVDLFAKNMLNLASPVAKNVQIAITIPAGLEFTKAYGINKAAVNGNQFTATLPDLYSGMDLPVLIHFLIKNNTASEALMVSIRYLNTATGKSEIRNEQIQLSQQTAGSGSRQFILDAEQQKMYAVAFVNEQLLQMAKAFEKGETEKARIFLETGISQFNAMYPSTKDKDLVELSELMKKYRMAFRNISDKMKLKK